MNNKQFMKVIKLAWPEYLAEYESSGISFMCNKLTNLYIHGKLSQWEYEKSRAKIKQLIKGEHTLAKHLRKEGAKNYGHSIALTKEFWEELIRHYNTYGDVLPSRLVIQQLRIRFPECF